MDNFHTDSEVAARSNAAVPDMSDTLGTFVRTFAYSAVQEPLNGVSQLSDKILGTNIEPYIQVIEAPTIAKFGSITWHAEQIAGGLGMAADFLLLNKIMPSAVLKESTSATNMIGRSALTGAAYSGIFQPGSGNGDFLTERLSNAATGGVTFAALTGATIGLRAAGEAGTIENTVLSKAFKNSFISGVIAGVPAGIVNAESKSLLAGQGMVSSTDLLKSAYSFIVAGGPIGLAHMAGNFSSRSNESSNESSASRLPPASDAHSSSKAMDPTDRRVETLVPNPSSQHSDTAPSNANTEVTRKIETNHSAASGSEQNSGLHRFSVGRIPAAELSGDTLGKDISAEEFNSSKWEGPRSVFYSIFDQTLPLEIHIARSFWDDTSHIFLDGKGNIAKIQIDSRSSEQDRQNVYLMAGFAKLINLAPEALRSVSVIRERTFYSSDDPVLRAATSEEAQRASLDGARAYLSNAQGNEFTQFLRDRYGDWSYPLARGFHTQMDLEMAKLSARGSINTPTTFSEALDRLLALQQISKTIAEIQMRAPNQATKALQDSVSTQIADLNKDYPGIGLFNEEYIRKIGRPFSSDELETTIQLVNSGLAKNVEDATTKLDRMLVDLERSAPLVPKRTITTIPQATGMVRIDLRSTDGTKAKVARNSPQKPIDPNEVPTVVEPQKDNTLLKNQQDQLTRAYTMLNELKKIAEAEAEARRVGFSDEQLANSHVGFLVTDIAKEDITLMSAAKLAVDLNAERTTIGDVHSVQAMLNSGWTRSRMTQRHLSTAQLMERAGLHPTPQAVNDLHSGKRSLTELQAIDVMRPAITDIWNPF